MEQQAYRYDSYFWEKKHNKVDAYRIVGMQWVKSDATSVRIKNGISKQMIQIN